MARADIEVDVDLDSSGFRKGIQKAQSSVKKFASSAIGRFAKVGAAFLGIKLAKDILNLGLASEETASKFNAVFGPAADSMNEKLEELKETIPATTAELQDITATIATMTQAMGLTPDAAKDLSIELVKLGSDIASFNNLRPDEVFTKLRAAISGEFEPMKQLGVVINEARIKQEALNLGIGDGTDKLTAAQKSLVVYNILLNDTVKMQGDAAATADSASNKVKFMARDLKEAGTVIGEIVVPQVKAFADGLNIIVGGLKKLKIASVDGTKEVANDFEAMAEANLKARGELEETMKVVSRYGGTYGNIYEKAEDPKAVERNQKKIKDRADQLRKAYEELNDEARDELDNQIKINSVEDDGNAAREKATKQYELNRDLLNEQLKSLKGINEEETKRGQDDSKDGKTSSLNNAESNKEPKAIAKAIIDDKMRGNIKTGQISSSQIGDGSTAARMAARERASGLFLAGNDTMSGRRASGVKAASQTQTEKVDYQKQAADSLKVIESTMTE